MRWQRETGKIKSVNCQAGLSIEKVTKEIPRKIVVVNRTDLNVLKLKFN